MSNLVRFQVPPFETTSPTSLAALRRPLINPEATGCAAHCQPCPTCLKAQEKAIATAKKTSSDLGLRLSQLVEDAMVQYVARIEAEQTALIAAVLAGVLPHMADAGLRSALLSELSVVADAIRTDGMQLFKNPALDLGELPATAQIQIKDDPAMPMNTIDLRDGDSATRIDAQAIINACLLRLGKPTGPIPADITKSETSRTDTLPAENDI
jgi:hypothetical protein